MAELCSCVLCPQTHLAGRARNASDLQLAREEELSSVLYPFLWYHKEQQVLSGLDVKP